MSTYSNGADGSCQNCGAETAEEWHVYCSDCFRQAQGWDDEPRLFDSRPDSAALRFQQEDRERVSLLRLVERLGELERRVANLERERRTGA